MPEPTRRALLAAMGLGGLGLGGMTACAHLPTSGPVVRVGPSPTARATTGVQVAAQSPVPGGDPEVILAGFLTAMVETQGEWATARAYLTPEAQKTWMPGSQAAIYDAEAGRPVSTATSASLNVPLIGRLDAQGRFTPEHQHYRHDFGMTKVHGEWRIGRPPAGIVISRYSFERYYRALNLHFLNAQGTRFVVETVHRPADLLNAHEAMRCLLLGPSPWLTAAAQSAIPADTRLSASAVVIRDGIAEVSLTDTVQPLAQPQRVQVAAQVVGTLLQLDDVLGVRLLSNGQPWRVPGATPAGVLGAESLTAHLTLDARDSAAALAVRRGALGEIDPTAAGGLRLVGGPLGSTGWGHRPGAFALDRSGTVAAVVDADRRVLYRSGVTAGTVAAVARGTRLLRPQVLADTSIWTVDQGPTGPRLLVVGRDDATQSHDLDELARAEVLAFRVGPDQTRVALVVRQGGRGRLGLMRVRRGPRAAVDGWRPLPVTSTSGIITQVLDVAWVGADTLMVIGAVGDDDRRSIFRVAADGSRVENLGPAGSSGLPVTLSAFPRRSGTSALFVTDANEVWSFDAPYRWRKVLSECAWASLPG